MNTKLTAVATLAALSVIPAQAQPVLYGKANVSLNSVAEDDSEQQQLNSNASRIGLKGSYKVDDSLTAIYKMEFETFIDDGDKKGQTFSQRNIYAGFKGNFGQLIVGKSDTPLKLSQGKVDRFNDQKLGDIKNYVEGEDRVSNLVMYTTPTYNGFAATVAMVPGEDASAGKEGVADGTSIAISYTNTWLRASLASNSDIDSQDTTRFVIEGKMGALKLAGMVQSAEKVDGTSDEDSLLLSTEYKLNHGYIVKAQYGVTDYSNGQSDAQIAIGLDKKLNKTTKLFAYYASVEQDMQNTTVDKSDLAVGFEFKF